jgi:site-specific recombinase XerD
MLLSAFFDWRLNIMEIHPLEALIKQYLAEKDITRGSYELYNTILKQYVCYLKEHQIIYATRSDVNNYLDWKRNKGYSSRWIYHQITALRGLYKYLSRNQRRLSLDEVYAYDIMNQIKNEPIDKSSHRPVLTVEQAKKLILWTKENRKYIWHYRDHAIIYLMLTGGLRSVEIRRARKKDLRVLNNQLVLYVQGKGRRSADDYVKISKGVEMAINDYLNKRKDKNPYLFISHSKRSKAPYLSRTFFLRMFRKVLKEAGLDGLGLTPHSLRHTAATLNLKNGNSLEATRRFMRHANLSATLIYAHHTTKMTDDSENKIEEFIMQ